MDKVFFVGIGGAGMSNLALLFKSLGYEVSGSDIRHSEYTDILLSKGITVFSKHSESHIDKSFALVVFSSAIKDDNPELKKAKSLDIPVLRRGEALASIVNKYKNIIVSGTHGKTTATSLIGHILKSSGIKTNVYIGGKDVEFNDFVPDPEYFVVESDESDGSFLYFKPDILVITNIDRDHLNHYNNSFKNLNDAFCKLAENSGFVVVCKEDRNAFHTGDRCAMKKEFYPSEKFFAEEISYAKDGLNFILHYGEKETEVSVSLYGDKNVLNVLGAILAAKEAGVSVKDAADSLKTFVPPSRRMEIKYRGDFVLIDDHADHPTEISATLSAARKHFPDRRVIAVFQPHRFSRVKQLGREIALPFDKADIVIVTEIFPAFEEPIEGVNGKIVARFISETYPGKDVRFANSLSDAREFVDSILKKGDLVILLGPGDIGELSGLFFF